MGEKAFRLRSLWLGVVAPVALMGLGAPAQAQGIFCPPTAPSGAGAPTLQSGLCTNGVTGAFSNAALASQALSDVTQASSDQSTNTAVEAISARRRIEEVQQQAPPSEPRERKLPPREPSRTSTKTEPLIYKAPIAPVPYEPHWGVWVEGFGDYDRLTGQGTFSCATTPGCPLGSNMNLSFTTKATTGGFVAGVDRTYRNFGPWGGTLITGILTGYLSSNLSSSATSSPATAAAVGTGFSNLSGRLTGPSLGAYATYFVNGFSTDLTLKVDFLHLNESFAESLSFSVRNPNIRCGPGYRINQSNQLWNCLEHPAKNLSVERFVDRANCRPQVLHCRLRFRCSRTRLGGWPRSSVAGRCASGYSVPLEQCRGNPDLDRARLRRRDRVRLGSN